MPELIVESGPLSGASFSFDCQVTLGRGELADVRLDDVTVSRRHAEVRPQLGAWEVVDLGSANGVLVNDERIAGPRRLADGDRIGIGQVVLRFGSARPAAATPTPVTPLPAVPAGGAARVFQDLLSRVRLFCDLGDLGNQKLDAPTLARRALEALLRAWPRTDRAALFVVAPMGAALNLLAQASREQRATQHAAVAPLAQEALRHAGGLVLTEEGERHQLTERLRMAPLYGAAAAIPLRHNGEPIGALYLDSLKDAHALRASDREALVAAANLLACLLAPSREPARDREVERHDLALARRIQQRFLPQSPPSLSGYAIVDDYAAARVIGGDHYDFLSLADGRQALVVADVSGKAVSGALYMARLGAVLRQAAGRTRRATELLDDINATLYAELEAGMFVTMLVLVLEPRSGALELAAAGHPAPLVRRADGSVAELAVEGGPPLGAMSEPSYGTTRHVLEPGECLLLYTDGLDEAHDPEGALFGLDRVRAALAGADSAQEAIAALRESLAAFVGNEPQSDDLTLLAVQRL
jgi:serine phosphatase RsbU (regulator of sigma subunit)/pSer/pThr/pTyr-binding forkhead associated (FHA) protein